VVTSAARSSAHVDAPASSDPTGTDYVPRSLTPNPTLSAGDFIPRSVSANSPLAELSTSDSAVASSDHELRLQSMATFAEEITVFLSVSDSTRRARIRPALSTLEDVRKLFVERFPHHGLSFKDKSFYLIHKDTLQSSRVEYELEECSSDLYPNCLIKLRSSGRPRRILERGGFAEYGLQRKKLVVVMVGLPARGKSFIARKLARYLNWLQVKSRVFNVGSYRRHKLGAHQPHTFFDPSNIHGMKSRRHMAVAALDDMIEWLHVNGRVGVFDATNTTRERRRMLVARLRHENVDVMFVESICTKEDLIESNIHATKLTSPDYIDMDPDEAARDFRSRLAHYEKQYEPITEDDLSYIKLINVGEKVISNLIDGYLQCRINFFLMHLHIKPRPIWFTRHGQSLYNQAGRIGGDSDLTESGENYAHCLADWVGDHIDLGNQPLTVWTSTLVRTIHTAKYIPVPKIHLRALDEIDAGSCDGMTYEEIAEAHPDEFQARAQNKLTYRYPMGESYVDVIRRLEPVIFELERSREPVLVVGHRAVLRALYAYFMDIPAKQCPFLDVPLHHVIELTPRAYGCEEKRFKLSPLSSSASGVSEDRSPKQTRSADVDGLPVEDQE